MNSQTSRKTNEMPDCTKRPLRVQNTSPVWNETKRFKMTFPPFFSLVVREIRFGCPRIARVISSEELGTMSKNNLRRITLVRGPIWGIRSHTLIISCFNSWPFWVSKSFFSCLPYQLLFLHRFFSPKIRGDGPGRVSWWHLAKRRRVFYLQTPALLKAELWKLSI